MSNVKVRGVESVIRQLERKLGKSNMRKVTDEALTAGALVFGMELRRQMRTFKDKGYTLQELTISEPMNKDGDRTIIVHWEGPHNRYRIIHLNEWGTIKNPNPRGKGKIAKALKLSEKPYRETIKQVMRRGI